MEGQEIVGRVAAELLDTLDEDESEEITDVIVVALVQNDETSGVRWRSSETIWPYQVGLLHACLEAMSNQRGSGDDADE